MADFHPTSTIVTLHEITGVLPTAGTEAEARTPVILVLPIHAADLALPGVSTYLQKLAATEAFDAVVLCLDHAVQHDLERAIHFSRPFGTQCRIVHTNGGPVQSCFRRIEASFGVAYQPGKGSNLAAGMWTAVAVWPKSIIVTLDVDLASDCWDAGALQRLLWPLLARKNALVSKAYYPRVHKGEFRGRVNRLLVLPLLNAFAACRPLNSVSSALLQFRYALSGEVAMRSDLTRALEIQQGWGYDTRLLGELIRLRALDKTVQIPFVRWHDHRHPSLEEASIDTPRPRGVTGIALGVCRELLALLERDLPIEPAERESILMHYRVHQDRLLSAYEQDALFNGLSFSMADEAKAALLLQAVVGRALGEAVVDSALPSWNTILDGDPAMEAELRSASVVP